MNVHIHRAVLLSPLSAFALMLLMIASSYYEGIPGPILVAGVVFIVTAFIGCVATVISEWSLDLKFSAFVTLVCIPFVPLGAIAGSIHLCLKKEWREAAEL